MFDLIAPSLDTYAHDGLTRVSVIDPGTIYSFCVAEGALIYYATILPRWITSTGDVTFAPAHWSPMISTTLQPDTSIDTFLLDLGIRFTTRARTVAKG